MTAIRFGQLAVFSIFALDSLRLMRYNTSKDKNVGNCKVLNELGVAAEPSEWKRVEEDVIVELIKDGEIVDEITT